MNRIMQVAVTGRQRGGTTVFRQLLGSSKNSIDLGEIFHSHTDLKFNFWSFLHHQMNIDTRNRHPSTWPTAWDAFIKDSAKYYGVKTVVFDLKLPYFPYVINYDETGINSFCFNEDTRLVLIERKNVARQIISGLIASQTNDWAEPAAEAPTWMKERFSIARGDVPAPRPRAPISIVPQDLYGAINHMVSCNKKIDELLESRLYAKVEYENLFDESGVFKSGIVDLAAHITGIEKSDLQPQPFLRKQGPTNIFDDIENAEEVSKFFADTEYAWMFHASHEPAGRHHEPQGASEHRGPLETSPTETVPASP